MAGGFGEGAPAFAGVDTHKGSHTLALLDALGRRLGAREFPADAAGVAELVAAAGAAGVCFATLLFRFSQLIIFGFHNFRRRRRTGPLNFPTCPSLRPPRTACSARRTRRGARGA